MASRVSDADLLTGARFHLTKQSDGLRLEAWLGRIRVRYHRFDFNCHN